MDTVTKYKRSLIMASVRSSGNKSTEKAFIRILSVEGIAGWRRKYALYGKPDFVFLSSRIAVFIDGCFWHYCPKHCRIPSTNSNYWINKIINNSNHDRQITAGLKKRGWTVIRLWEHDLKGGRNLTNKISKLRKLIYDK